MANILGEYLTLPGNSQEDLAERMDVWQSTISRWLNGRVPAERVLELEQLTNIPRKDLRTDIYPDPIPPRQ